MHVDRRRGLGGQPLAARVHVVAEQLLLLGVDRNDRPMCRECLADLVVDEPKLRIPIRGIVPLFRLPIPLRAVVHGTQELRDRFVADRMSGRRQGRRGTRVLLLVQRSGDCGSRATGARRALPGGWASRDAPISSIRRPPPGRATAGGERRLLQFLEAFRDRDPRQPARPAHDGHAPMAELPRHHWPQTIAAPAHPNAATASPLSQPVRGQ